MRIFLFAPMGTFAQALPILTPAMRLSKTTLGHIADRMRPAGMLPRGDAGQEAGQLGPLHLVDVLLAPAAPTLASSVETAQRLGQLGPEAPRAGDTTLRTALAMELERHANLILRGEMDAVNADPHLWELWLCAEPPSAWMIWRVGDTEHRRYYCEEPQSALPGVTRKKTAGIRRATIIDVGVLNAAATVVADTFAHEATYQSSKPTGVKPTEIENAGSEPPETGILSVSKQTTDSWNASFDNLQSNESGKHVQDAHLSGLFTSNKGTDKQMLDRVSFPVIHACRWIAARTGRPGPHPQRVYAAATRGAFPFEKRSNGRLYMDPAYLPLVAKALDIELPEAAA